ncbi:MAG TPA: FAD-binding oxidoreductase [Xanthobacteraceae bacterium]|nr:FAD-binding oxidoreductase [Xanthobacteraceae bacterium]
MTAGASDSFYATTAVPHAPRPRLVQDVDTGVCIVGGGFAGLWTARALARRGYEVAIVEAGTIAGEASGRNGGFVSAGFAERLPRIVERVGIEQAKRLYALSRRGMEIVSDTLAEGIPGVDPVPGRLNVQRFDDLDGVRRQAEFLAEHFGHEMLVWPTERVRETLKTERYYQALHDADAFSVHPLNLALALAAEIEQRGGRIFERTRAIGADLEGVRKRIVTESGRVRASEVVFCGSSFIGKEFPQLDRTILPVSTYVCTTAPIPEQLREAIRYGGAIADTRRAGDYYRITGDRLLWGGRISTRTSVPRGLKKKLGRDIARVYPSLKGVEIEHAWAGTMGYTIHRMPQIGLLKPGAWVASGFGGHGLNTAAMAGELISTAIVDHDERWRNFVPFGLVWAGGGIGRRLTQAVYWGMQLGDKYDESKSRFKEWRARRAAAAEAARKVAEEKRAVEAAEQKKVEDAARRKREQEELKKLLAQEEEEERRRKEEGAKDADSANKKPKKNKKAATEAGEEDE